MPVKAIFIANAIKIPAMAQFWTFISFGFLLSLIFDFEALKIIREFIKRLIVIKKEPKSKN